MSRSCCHQSFLHALGPTVMSMVSFRGQTGKPLSSVVEPECRTLTTSSVCRALQLVGCLRCSCRLRRFKSCLVKGESKEQRYQRWEFRGRPEWPNHCMPLGPTAYCDDLRRRPHFRLGISAPGLGCLGPGIEAASASGVLSS